METIYIDVTKPGLDRLRNLKGWILGAVVEDESSGKQKVMIRLDNPEPEANSKSFFTEEEESELIEALQHYAETDEIRDFNEVAKSIVMRLAASAIGYWRESQ